MLLCAGKKTAPIRKRLYELISALRDSRDGSHVTAVSRLLSIVRYSIDGSTALFSTVAAPNQVNTQLNSSILQLSKYLRLHVYTLIKRNLRKRSHSPDSNRFAISALSRQNFFIKSSGPSRSDVRCSCEMWVYKYCTSYRCIYTVRFFQQWVNLRSISRLSVVVFFVHCTRCDFHNFHSCASW